MAIKARVCLRSGKIVTVEALQRGKEGAFWVFLSNGASGRITRTYFNEADVSWMEIDEGLASLEAFRPQPIPDAGTYRMEYKYLGQDQAGNAMYRGPGGAPVPEAAQSYVPPPMQERKLRASVVAGMPVSETPEGVVNAGFMS